jgi:hypothetical protein
LVGERIQYFNLHIWSIFFQHWMALMLSGPDQKCSQYEDVTVQQLISCVWGIN